MESGQTESLGPGNKPLPAKSTSAADPGSQSDKENIVEKMIEEKTEKPPAPKEIVSDVNNTQTTDNGEINSETESDDGLQEVDPNAPPRGTFPNLSFQVIHEQYIKSRNKRRRTNKSARVMSQKRQKVLPQRTYPKAPVKISKIRTINELSDWVGWATQCWKKQKIARDQRLGPRDLGYHNDLTSFGANGSISQNSLAKRGRPRLEATETVISPAVDDRKLPKWKSSKPPPLSQGVLGLPGDLIRPALNAWGFIRNFQYLLGLKRALEEEYDLTLEKFLDALSHTEDELPVVSAIFAGVLRLCLEATLVDSKKELLIPDGKRAWLSVNNVTWQYHLLQYLENLEKRRITQLTDEEADDEDKDGDKNQGEEATAYEMMYYGQERCALEREKLHALPLRNKLRLLPLLIDKALSKSGKFSIKKHLDEGMNVAKELKTKHKKLKPKRQREVTSVCASVYADMVDEIVKSSGSTEEHVPKEKYELELNLMMEREFSKIERKNEIQREKEVKEHMRKYPLRATTLYGLDRYLRRYYVFGTPDEKIARAIYVFDPVKKLWGVYDSYEQLKALKKFLNHRGIREKALLEGLNSHTWKFPVKKEEGKEGVKLKRELVSTPIRGGKAQKKINHTPGRLKVNKELQALQEDNKKALPSESKIAAKIEAVPENTKESVKETEIEVKPAKAEPKSRNDSDSEDYLEDNGFVTKKLTRSQKKQEIQSSFVPPDVNAPLKTDPQEKKYLKELYLAKDGLIASQILLRFDGKYLPSCYICQEALSEDEWHCPYTHRTWPKSELDAEDFAIMLADAKKSFEEGKLPSLNNVSRRFKVIKALLMDVEAAILEESTLTKNKREMKAAREKWLDKVKRATELYELVDSLVDLNDNLHPDWIRPWFKRDLWRVFLNLPCVNNAIDHHEFKNLRQCTVGCCQKV